MKNNIQERVDCGLADTGGVSLHGFILLSVISGVTIGFAKVATQLFAIDLGATPAQVGLISTMESAGMMLFSLPAGLIVTRYGARTVYAVASLGPFLLNLALPFLPLWWMLAGVRLLIGMCIPFRTVSMNTAFLERLPSIGLHRAGWYRASLMFGMVVLGPAVASVAIAQLSFNWCFVLIAFLFLGMATAGRSFFPDRSGNGQKQRISAGQGKYAGMFSLLAHPVVLRSCLTEGLSGATTGVFGGFIVVLAVTLPATKAADGVLALTANGIGTVAVLFLGARLVAYFNRRVALAAGFILMVLALAVLGRAEGLIGLVTGSVLLSLGGAQVHLVNMMEMSALSFEKGRVSAFYQLSQMVGATTGGLIGAGLVHVIAVQQLFLVWAIAILIGFAVITGLLYRSHTEKAGR